MARGKALVEFLLSVGLIELLFLRYLLRLRRYKANVSKLAAFRRGWVSFSQYFRGNGSSIPTSIVHCKLDYCTSLYYNLPKSQIARLQQIHNSLARVVVKTPKCCHISPILHSLHWLKITERIEYKLLSPVL